MNNNGLGIKVPNDLTHPGSNNNFCRVQNLQIGETIRVEITQGVKLAGDPVDLDFDINITPFSANPTPFTNINPQITPTTWAYTQNFTNTGLSAKDTRVGFTIRDSQPSRPQTMMAEARCFCQGSTVSNDGEIQVEKKIAVGSPQTETFDFETTNLNPNNFNLGHNDTQDFTGLSAGIPFTVTEVLTPAQLNAGWQLTGTPQCSVTVDNGVQNNTVIDTSLGNKVIITLGQEAANVSLDQVKCTYTNELDTTPNQDLGSLRIIKNSVGGNGQFSFDVAGLTPTGGNITTVNGTGALLFNNLTPSTQGNPYVITETALPNGWALNSITCDSGNPGPANIAQKNISVSVLAGQTTTCTFTNQFDRDDRTMDVIKKFINRRVDNLLSHDPDRSRIQRRLDQQRQRSMKDTQPMKLRGNVSSGSFHDFKDLNMKFSTSLSQLRAAALAQTAKKMQAAQSEGYALGFGSEQNHVESLFLKPQRFDIWAEGHYSHYKDSEGGFTSDGDFGILYLGADYAVNEWLLIGALVQFDWTEEDIDGADLFGEIEGDGWMVGPYVGMKLSDQIYFSARAAWGESDNDIVLTDSVFGTRRGSFKTDRWLASAELTGNWYYDRLKISPSVKLSYGNENQDSFLNSLGLLVSSSDITIGRLTFGPEFSYNYKTKDGTIIQPQLSIEGIWNFDQDVIVLSNGDTLDYQELRGKIEGGVMVRLPSGTSFRLTGNYDGIGDDDLESYGGQLWVSIPLNE